MNDTHSQSNITAYISKSGQMSPIPNGGIIEEHSWLEKNKKGVIITGLVAAAVVIPTSAYAIYKKVINNKKTAITKYN